MIAPLAREVLALVHHLAGRDGIDARTLHTVMARPDVPVQRVRSTLYNLAALGYVERAAMSGAFLITAGCKPPPDGTPLRPSAAVARAAVARPVATARGRSIAGAIARHHTPNSVFDVERL